MRREETAKKVERKYKSPREGKEKKCRNCGNNKGLIVKYKLYLCRRCFKDNAEAIGFRKYF